MHINELRSQFESSKMCYTDIIEKPWPSPELRSGMKTNTRYVTPLESAFGTFFLVFFMQ